VFAEIVTLHIISYKNKKDNHSTKINCFYTFSIENTTKPRANFDEIVKKVLKRVDKYV